MAALSILDRFMSHVAPCPFSGCWLWTGYIGPQGYGRIQMKLGSRPAHRVSYVLFIGAIPDGLDIHHICRLPCCVNPAHLRAVTAAENNSYRLMNEQPKILSNLQRQTTFERFQSKVLIDSSGCWLWLGVPDVSGYGVFHDGGNRFKAHRWSYERFVGPIVSGLQIDHLCRVRRCVNPTHLEPVTLQENLRRGSRNAAAVQAGNKTRAAVTHCPQGHEYTPGNTYQAGNSRHCLECNRTRSRERARKIRAALKKGAH